MIALLACAALLVLLIGSLVFWACGLALGLRWARISPVTWHGVLWTTATVFGIQIVAYS